MSALQLQVERAASWVATSDALLITAGAGLGVDSGLPDFRGVNGFWHAYPACGDAGITFEDIANPNAFQTMPDRAWGFYGHRLRLYRKTVPHAGFRLLKQWAQRMRGGCSIFTSNVDGQFQKAGFGGESVHECHGSIHYLQCLRPCGDHIWPADDFQPEVDERQCVLRNVAPTCPGCGELARPNVLMFNDWGWREVRTAAEAADQTVWLSSVSRPVVVELGAGAAIPSVRRFSERVVRDFGSHLIRINPRESQVSNSDDIGLAMGALAGLQAITGALDSQWPSW